MFGLVTQLALIGGLTVIALFIGFPFMSIVLLMNMPEPAVMTTTNAVMPNGIAAIVFCSMSIPVGA